MEGKLRPEVGRPGSELALPVLHWARERLLMVEAEAGKGPGFLTQKGRVCSLVSTPAPAVHPPGWHGQTRTEEQWWQEEPVWGCSEISPQLQGLALAILLPQPPQALGLQARATAPS